MLLGFEKLHVNNSVMLKKNTWNINYSKTTSIIIKLSANKYYMFGYDRENEFYTSRKQHFGRLYFNYLFIS
jgi:hypothetical protein